MRRNGIPYCDEEVRPGPCYDRNDNPTDYCENYSQSDLQFCLDAAPGVTCGNEGYDDGQDGPFNQETFDKCGDQYYDAFIEGCVNADNTREICGW
jgi:hypothetical protein